MSHARYIHSVQFLSVTYLTVWEQPCQKHKHLDSSDCLDRLQTYFNFMSMQQSDVCSLIQKCIVIDKKMAYPQDKTLQHNQHKDCIAPETTVKGGHRHWRNCVRAKDRDWMENNKVVQREVREETAKQCRISAWNGTAHICIAQGTLDFSSHLCGIFTTHTNI